MGGNTNDSLALYNVRAAMTSTDAFGANPITLGGCVLTNTGNLTFSNNEVINFALGTNDSIMVVTGNLNLSGTLNLTNAAGFTATNYILFAYTGSLTNSPVLGAKPVLNSYVYRLDTNTAGQVKLVVVQPSPPRLRNHPVCERRRRLGLYNRHGRRDQRPVLCSDLDEPCAAAEPMDARCDQSF